MFNVSSKSIKPCNKVKKISEHFHLQVFLYQTFFRSSRQRCSVKKVFLEISQISQENTYARVYLLIKMQA